MGHNTVDAITESNNEKIMKQEPVEQIVVPVEKRNEILDKLRKAI